MPASYPTSAKSFTTKNTGDTVQAAHIDDLQAEVTAIETDLIAGLPLARGGTGVTTIGTRGKKLTSTGSVISFQSLFVEDTTTSTGQQDNFNLISSCTLLRCTGAAPNFTGFTVAGSAPSAGDAVILECLGATSLKVTDQATSTAANQIICESTRGQIVGAKGRILCVYDGTTTKWRATALDCGAPLDVTYDAANFTASSGNWTVGLSDQATFAYFQRGKLLTITYVITASTVSATPATLSISLLGFTATKQMWGVGTGNRDTSSATYESTPIQCQSGVGTAQIHRQAFGNWATVTDLCDVYGTFMVEVD